MHHKTFSPGDIIFREGDESEEAFWVVSGKVEISMETADGPKVLTTLSDGEIFGEMGMIDDQPRSATARAVTITEVEVINEADFQQEIVRRENRLMPYLDTLFDRLRTANAHLRAHFGKTWREPRLDSTSAPPNPSHEVLDTLTVLSAETSAALYPEGLRLDVTRFPFRIGRRNDDGHLFSRMDLPLFDQRPFVVSRSHCRIESQGAGYFVRDCGSHLGTIVNGVPIGTEYPNFMASLTPGENTITIGPEGSPHQYLIVVKSPRSP
jgi:CRP/FNR family cyclic AMP-dependent transcriptional regulator